MLTKQTSETPNTFNNMDELKNGRFTYSVQAAQNLPDGTLARRSEASSASFAIDLPAAGDIVIDDMGVLYGM